MCHPEVPEYLINTIPPVEDYLPAHDPESVPDVHAMDHGYTLWVGTWLKQLDMHVG